KPLWRAGMVVLVAFISIGSGGAWRAAREPLFARLAPDFDGILITRGRHVAGALQGGTQPFRDRLRGLVGGRDAMDDTDPAEVGEGPVDRGRRGFGRVTLAPRFTRERPADFIARPAIRMQGTDAADPTAGALLDHRKRVEAEHVPRADRRREMVPRIEAAFGAAKMMHDFLVPCDRGPCLEIIAARRTQDQPLRFERGFRLRHGIRHRWITSLPGGRRIPAR